MIGSKPTVGCIVFLRERNPSIAIQQVLSALETTLAVKCQSRSENKWIIKADFGDEEIKGLLFALEENEQVAVFVEFDEEKCVQIANRQRKSLDSLFLPYADVLKQVPDVIAVGIGFEMAAPTEFDDASLKDAGIAVLFEQIELGQSWQRRDIYHLTCHAEKPLVAAA